MSEVKIKVNGKEYIADSDKHLLDNLTCLGFDIPNLCYAEELDCYGGCGLCLVEPEGGGKLMRSCAVYPRDGMAVLTDSEAVRSSRKITLSLLLSDHTGDCRPPCRTACPTHQDARGYIALIGEGRYDDALRLIREDNPLPASIGRVCPHPCEEKCRRGMLEGAVSICSLKRFAADNGKCEMKPGAPTGKRVAVIGAGPAGLSAAYFLRLKGHAVTVFESEEKAGGMLRYGIPAYRLPKDVLDAEIAVIEQLGAEFKYSTRLGRDITIEQLKRDYDAVFAAVGAWKSASLGCDGDSLPGVHGGIDFLYKAANNVPTGVSGRVAVVGGGNTAIDAVRTAVRLGASEVTLIYRRTRAEMPAEEIEIKEAEEEGVRFIFLASPLSVIEKDGKAAGLRLQRMRLGEPDASGRRKPEPIEGAVDEVEFDAVISAIGQKVSPEGLEAFSLTRRGTVPANTVNFSTSVEGVFAGGDAVNDGPGIAVSAIAHGKNAAFAIDDYLSGRALKSCEPFYVENDGFKKEDIGERDTVLRSEQACLDPEIRRSNFEQVASGFTEEQARKEASRCLECGCDAIDKCRLLPLLNEYKAYEKRLCGAKRNGEKDGSHETIKRDANKCILCGLCVRVCREKEGVEALGLFGRGFDTAAQCAYGTGLAKSTCDSCGECARLCPTGAIISYGNVDSGD